MLSRTATARMLGICGLLLAGGGVSGCGGASYLVLEFTCEDDSDPTACSRLDIPDDIDTLKLTITAKNSGEQLASFPVELADDQTYPVTVLLEPNEDRPKQLSIRVDGLLGGENGQLVAVADFDVTWEEGKDNFAEPPIKLTPIN